MSRSATLEQDEVIMGYMFRVCVMLKDVNIRNSIQQQEVIMNCICFINSVDTVADQNDPKHITKQNMWVGSVLYQGTFYPREYSHGLYD